MFETYGFEAGYKFSPTEVVNFDELQGMKCVSVSDSASVNFNIQSTTNPFQDGQQFQNRRAQGREMTLVFSYDYTITPEDADRAFFSKIPFGLSQNDFYDPTIPPDFGFRLFKKQGEVKKTIMCAIKSIEHQVYDENPQLEIVLSTEAFWSGENETVTLESDPSKDTAYYFAYHIDTKGDVATDFMFDIFLTPKEGRAPLDTSFQINTIAYLVPGDTGDFETLAIPVNIRNDSDYVRIQAGWDERVFIFELTPKGTSPGVPLYDFQVKNFPRLYPNTRTILFEKRSWYLSCNMEITIRYTPKYIR